MMPDSIVLQIIHMTAQNRAAGEPELEALRKALNDSMSRMCTCGSPLMLGVVHHKNAPCEVAK